MNYIQSNFVFFQRLHCSILHIQMCIHKNIVCIFLRAFIGVLYLFCKYIQLKIKDIMDKI